MVGSSEWKEVREVKRSEMKEITSGGLPHNQAAHSVNTDDDNGVYIWISRTWWPEESGIKAEPYPRITSLPRKSIPATLNAILGHPNGFVDLNLISIGKFQITDESEPIVESFEICEIPLSIPCQKKINKRRRKEEEEVE